MKVTLIMVSLIKGMIFSIVSLDWHGVVQHWHGMKVLAILNSISKVEALSIRAENQYRVNAAENNGEDASIYMNSVRLIDEICLNK